MYLATTDGVGTLSLVNGDKYVGLWRHGTREGLGVLTTNGAKYVGEFKGGKYEGVGAMSYADGGRYVGQWTDGRANGEGILTNADGSEYAGQWIDGFRNGKGVMHYADHSFLDGKFYESAQKGSFGFNFQQLGYTMDGVPLGDQNYGNYNGLSPQRAVISENVSRSVVTTGAGDLGTPSTSNLGGTVEVFSSDPLPQMGAQVAQTLGSYGTARTYVRVDTGTFGNGNSLALSGDRQRARAWDFNGVQGGYQANAKFVHEDAAGKLTVFFDYSDKAEPNEDATSFTVPAVGGTLTAAQLFTPYTRAFLYPNYAGMKAYLSAFGNTPAGEGSNYRNYYSDAQRTDYLGYIRYDAHVTDKISWSNQFYVHHNDGAGVVNGPLGQSITTIQPYLDPNYATDAHFGGNGNGTGNAALGNALLAATGGSGLVNRTTEYRIDRFGLTSHMNIDLGAHQIEVGGWWEHNSSTQWRRWYAVQLNNISAYSPYVRPSATPTDLLFTQYQGENRTDELQFHVQDDWQVTRRLSVEAGLKTSAQYAHGWYPVQPVAGSLSGLTGGLPQGRIATQNWFLPAFGAKYDLNGHEALYVNVQKNLRQFMTYEGGGSLSPWFMGSQTAFNAFAQSGRPETSWTYEAGLRSHRSFGGLLSAIEGQVNYYHVVFNNRQLAISVNPGGIAGGGITGGTAILVNVGSVHTDGVDAAFTAHFGHNFSVYNALSYNTSTYQSDYYSSAISGTGAASGTCIGGVVTQPSATAGVFVVPTCGKQVPGTPTWMNKTVATASYGPFELQLIGDFVGKRWATYVNDSVVPSYFLTSLRLAAKLPESIVGKHKAEFSVNVTNLANKTGWSTVSVGGPTNSAKTYSWSAYPIAPRQWFATLSLGL